jgi:futalosine hydrolase
MANTLVLVPTPFERKILDSVLLPLTHLAGGTLHLCGFGPVAAAARTSQLISRWNPARIVLTGIAGAIGDQLPIGSANSFDEVACFGIGVGGGEHFETASAAGWAQWGSDAAADSEDVLNVGDVLALNRRHSDGDVGYVSDTQQLLTCCAASANSKDVELKRRCFPTAIAEDMEGFGVAMACALAGVPFQIVRGISNVAGDRSKDRWMVREALEAAAELTCSLIADDSQWS